MCTVSFLPAADGFDLLMNRDEQRSRREALPPAIHRCGEQDALYPHEASGGTWVGVNGSGLTLALINWYAQPQRAGQQSRGIVIPKLLAARTSREVEVLLRTMSLTGLNPFRLIVITPDERHLHVWQSNGTQLDRLTQAWEKTHWFSSGHDEEQANRVRALTCLRAAEESDADTLPWLRRLHRSHHPAKDAFSICMHRADACTVSCTEVSVNSSTVELAYQAGSPCQQGPRFTGSLVRSGTL